MSTNTTSTSDRIASDSPTSSTPQPEGGRDIRGLTPAMAALPDPAVIARLANEFFAALPASATPGPALSASANSVNLRGVSEAAAPGSVPDYPREMFSLSNAPNPTAIVDSIPSAPKAPSSPPTGALNEADFRAIAASLAGMMPLVPQAPAIPSSSPPSAEVGVGGPWASPPQIPPAAEMYSFPGVPAMPSSPPTAPPSGLDLATVRPPAVATGVHASPTGDSNEEGRTDPWAAPPHFAGLNDVYSFPRAPGASVPGIPEIDASEPSVPASQPVLGKNPVAPSSAVVTTAPESAPAILKSVNPKSASAATLPDVTKNLGEAERAVYPGEATNFPPVSQMFSFPGVPGVQSPPGVPVLPSSLPTKLPTETDLRALPTAPGSASAVLSQVPGVRLPEIPTSSGILPGAERVTPQSAPADAKSFEFRPDLEPAELGVAKRPLDPRLIRQDFPILQERVHGRQLIWLDNAATTQKPNAVIDRLSYFYRHENSNIHRAAHTLAARATDAYESAREKTRRFLNASSTREIIFVRGTTEGINLVAKSWGQRNIQKDDEIVITWLEHHANIVPWQQLCSATGARLRVAPVNDRGEVILEEYERLLSPRTRIVSFSHVSNALGTITPAREMVEMAHRHGARVLVDGAQAVSHMRTDVQALDCDFYVFSGHKIFGPTGIGAVYGKLDVLDNMPPWQGGGNMIVDVTFEKTTYNTAPARFEAGTGNIADAVGLGAALDYVEQVGMESISAYEHELLRYGTERLLTVPGLRLIGTAHDKASVMSFVLDDVRTEDVGAALNEEGIAVRSGHHCAQPILRRMGVESTVRPSLAFYNTCEEIDALVAALLRIQAQRG
jgi:cysteine desulfurase/selenocysteine lyase